MCVWPGIPKSPKVTSLLLSCNVLRKKWMINLIFCMQISMTVSPKFMLWFSQNSNLQCLCNTSKKKSEIKLNLIMHLIKIKVSYKLVLSLLTGMIQHSQSTQSNKFAISLQYLKKEAWVGVCFLHADKH